MIARLTGEVVELDSGRVTIDVHGVGYEVLVPLSLVHTLEPLGQRVTVSVRQVFREDGVTLYGFNSPRQRRLFDLLIDVKGCGPKTALSLIGDVGEDSVAAALASQDTRTLSLANGVGPRLAERLILELRDKIQSEGFAGRASDRAVVSTAGDELVDALMALGYRKQEAEQAAESTTDEGTLQERLRSALQVLRK